MILPYYDMARRAAESQQGVGEADYWSARSALAHGDLRRCVGLQQAARVSSAAARAAYQTWVGCRR